MCATTEQELRQYPLFRNCSDSFFTDMANDAHVLKTSKGQVLFLHDDPAERFYYISSGWVKLFRETLDGAQAVVDVFTRGNIIGEGALFEDNIYPYTAEVVEAGSLMSLSLSILNRELQSNNQFTNDMLGFIARNKRQKDKEIEHISLQNAPQRIGCFLLGFLNKTEGGATIHLPYDKTLVASRLGMQPETFSRALGKLKVSTGINVKGATIEVSDIETLVSFSCVACSAEFPCKELCSKC